jgi:hypothetical protein
MKDIIVIDGPKVFVCLQCGWPVIEDWPPLDTCRCDEE